MAKRKDEIKQEDLDLLEELGVDTVQEKPRSYSKLEERVIADFEEINRWVGAHGRLPRPGAAASDFFERRYAIRLRHIWDSEQWRELLQPFDTKNLLSPPAAVEEVADDDESLLASLGLNPQQGDLLDLRHVRSTEERRIAEEIGRREPCADFADYKSLFAKVQSDLGAGVRQTQSWESDKSVSQDDWFIVGGQLAYVVEEGEEFKQPYGFKDARLRVIYDNGTQSIPLRRSLQKALLIDKTSRRVRKVAAGPLFAGTIDEGDVTTGTIYVLRSLSDHPYIQQHREVIHKIGVTGGNIHTRIANAASEPTYLLAPVEVVATYKLANIHRHKLEALLHRVFTSAQLDLTLPDRFGKPFRPREWFLVPLPAVQRAVELLQASQLQRYVYNPAIGELEQLNGGSPSVH